MSFCGLTIILENKQQQQKFCRETIELTFKIQKAKESYKISSEIFSGLKEEFRKLRSLKNRELLQNQANIGTCVNKENRKRRI